MPLVLLVEDEPLICEFTQHNLEEDGFQVVSASNGREALRLLESCQPDVIVLDIMLPDMDGFDLCRRLRRGEVDTPLQGPARLAQTPIIMLTARAEDADKIKGFVSGADDYMVKPFNPLELTARIKAILRRARKEQKSIALGDLVIDPVERTVHSQRRILSLSPKEFDLLYFLCSHPDKVFSRQELLQEVWGYSYPGGTRTVDEHIKRLRKKIELDAGCSGLICTEWSVGYKLESRK
ncbi:MAG: response regulator transcription factor [Chloroflexi bacterium]|nr:response regulator transcription factor [Chloroflexota bacterium]